VEFTFLISLSYFSTRKNAKKEPSSFKQLYFEQKHIITINEFFSTMLLLLFFLGGGGKKVGDNSG